MMNGQMRYDETFKDYFADESLWQSWLDVEAALALTQSELGMIPPDAGMQIAQKAQLSNLNLAQLRAEISHTMAPVYALSESLANAVGPAGAYVHWGATTQNIMETGRLLVLKRVQTRILNGLADILAILSDQAKTHANLVMVGRTNRQNALPITYGFKIAGWIDELIRVAQQLREVEPRIFQLRFGGAIGGYHSFGPQGPQLAGLLAERLGLHQSLVPNRTSIDPLIEYITKLSMLGIAIGRISGELYLLMTEEICEVSEALTVGVVGSSTMPQKVNPKHVIKLNAISSQLQSKAAAALAISSPSHEGDALINQQVSQLTTETCSLAIEVLEKAMSTFVQVEPNISRMRENFLKSREFMATEALMMKLANKTGRSRAHDLVHEIVGAAKLSGQPLKTLLIECPEIVGAIGSDAIEELLCINENSGLCAEISMKTAAVGKHEANTLKKRKTTLGSASG